MSGNVIQQIYKSPGFPIVFHGIGRLTSSVYKSAKAATAQKLRTQMAVVGIMGNVLQMEKACNL